MRVITTKLPLILIGIFSSDLHKYVINLFAAIVGNPLSLVKVASSIDALIGAMLLCIIMYKVYRKDFELNRFNRLIIYTNILLVLMYIVTLLLNFDNLSFDFFIKFIAGNIGLLFSVLLFCKTKEDIKLVMWIWLIVSIAISLISITFFVNGINYTSTRAKIMPGITFRVGYMSAIAIIYIIISKLEFKIKRIPANYFRLAVIIVLFLGVVSSGSKASLILLAFTVLAYYFFNRTSATISRKSLIFSIIISLSVITIILVFGTGKYGRDLLNLESYVVSLSGRLELLSEYITHGLKSPLIGSKISDSYTVGSNRTHSIMTAIFVHTGILGLLSYILFISRTIYIGFLNSRHKNAHFNNGLLYIFLFALLFSEIASDIPGNRFLWMFSGFLIVFAEIANKNERLSTKEQS